MSDENSSIRQPIEALDGGFVCLVNGEGEYNLSEAKLKELITYVDPKGTQDYSIVGIMGCQSSGKSTLLNRLFGTKFQMMDSDRGRQQTTKGIWLDAARTTENLVVMDLEGTDSGERGEDRTTFERQTILYGLALCEVLIVNMWEHDIGRYTASNYGVLKTVFEVNLQLFKQQGKTMLLFVVRDHLEMVTPFEALKKKLRGEVEQIWKELRKPEEFTDASIDDFFDFRFEALSHKILMSDKFEEETTTLRHKFADSNHPDYFLNTEFHGAKSVPAESFAKYAHGIWETIRSNQDLNLPSQKEMLATFRCDELAGQALSQFYLDIAPVRSAASERFLPDVGARIGSLLSRFLSFYDEGAAKYATEVVSRKRVDFIAKLTEPCLELLNDQLAHISRSTAREFARALRETLPADVPTRSFYDVVATVRERTVREFHLAKDSLFEGLPKEAVVPLTKALAELDASLDRCVISARKDQFDRLLRVSLQRVKDALIQPLVLMLRNPGSTLSSQPSNSALAGAETSASNNTTSSSISGAEQSSSNSASEFWSKLGALFNASFSASTTFAMPYLVALKATEAERSSQLMTPLLERSEMFVYEHVMQQRNVLPMKLRQRFEASFLKDEQGIPRRWGAKENIRALFIASRDDSLQMIPLFSRFRLREFWGEEADDVAMSIPSGLNRFGSSGSELDSGESPTASPVSAFLKGQDSKKPFSMDVLPEGDGETEGETEEQKTSDTQSVASLSSLPKLSTPSRKTKPGFGKTPMMMRAGSATMLPAVPGPAVVLITAEQCADMERNFLLEIDSILTNTQREQERNVKATSVPPWAVLAMLILGWNELTALLRSPVILIFTLVIGFIALIVHSLGMSKPVLAMLTSSLQSAYDAFQTAMTPTEPSVGVIPTSTTSTNVSTPQVQEIEPNANTNVDPTESDPSMHKRKISSESSSSIDSAAETQQTSTSGLPSRRPAPKSYATLPAAAFQNIKKETMNTSSISTEGALRKRTVEL